MQYFLFHKFCHQLYIYPKLFIHNFGSLSESKQTTHEEATHNFLKLHFQNLIFKPWIFF